MLRLTVLGSCGTFPGAGRACSGYLLEGGELGARPTRVWVDTGSGSLSNLLRHAPVSDLDAIWVSHLHADHCNDLPLAYYVLRYGGTVPDRPVPVFGPTGWHEHMSNFMTTDATSSTTKDMRDMFEVHELHDGETITLGGLRLNAIETQHSVETYGVRATDGGSVLAYSADSGPCDALGRLASGADLFLCEAAWMRLPPDYRPIHCTPAEAGETAARAGAKKLVLTHVRPDSDPADATAQASQAYGAEVGFALEGDVYEFGDHQ
jgi:ribonuclease BN (tRNA processing enzyme)